MPVAYSNVYLHAAGMFLPGEPVDNAGMDAYVAPLNRLSERLKRRILAENGIVQRHYAIDAEGRTVHSNTAMAAQAIHDCLAQAGRALGDVGFNRITRSQFETVERLYRSEDQKEGARAFAEKRDPVWTGR